jgi:hypothetical protein
MTLKQGPLKTLEYLLTIPDVAKYFRVSEQTVRLWVRDKKLQAYRTPPDDGDLTIDPAERRSTLYVTRKAMAEWAEVYYKL